MRWLLRESGPQTFSRRSVLRSPDRLPHWCCHRQLRLELGCTAPYRWPPTPRCPSCCWQAAWPPLQSSLCERALYPHVLPGFHAMPNLARPVLIHARGRRRYESTSTKTSRRLSHELLLSLVSSVLLVRPCLRRPADRGTCRPMQQGVAEGAAALGACRALGPFFCCCGPAFMSEAAIRNVCSSVRSC